jgi:phospholipid/cholesterol/gamma-HCH transport system permease protein
MSAASYSVRADSTGSTLALAGDWTSLTIGRGAVGLASAVRAAREPLHLDISGLGRLDTSGAYLMLRAMPAELANVAAEARPDIAHLFSLVRPAMEKDLSPGEPVNWGRAFLEKVGRAVVSFGQESMNIADFAGRLNYALVRTIRHPRRLRTISLVHVMEAAGTGALPIVIIMNFFIGAVVALVGTNLLASLGVSVFTVELVGVAVLREFGVLITAILLAGRSASSFAAQIGTMKMTQEIDAMQVMGVDWVDALVIPRVLGLLLMMPLLVFAAMFAGVLGGLIVSWAALDMSPIFFLSRMQQSVDIRHFWVGMSKVPLLALLIAMAGCRHGLAVKGDVESLGFRVTRAVVQAIFMIILFDAVFAIIYMELNL